MGNNYLAIIPARGGSKRIPQKNLISLYGKPLISYTIEEARKSSLIKYLIVSTDNVKIANCAKKLGAKVPFLRPAKYATDNSPITETLLLIYKWVIKSKLAVDAFILLQPTSPFRTVKHINESIDLFKKSKADTVTSVRFTYDHPFWTWQYKNKRITPLFSLNYIEKPRYDLPPIVIENGAIFIIKPSVIEKGSLYGRKVVSYIMDEESSFDIDTLKDLENAERRLRERKK